jgi:hypothetical protein
MPRSRLAAALFVSLATGLLYWSTALPGFDLGDTASFQTMVGSDVIGPRDGYPLYFALTGLVFQVVGGDAARVANLTSAAAASLTCGLIVFVGWRLAGSAIAAVAAALLFAGSYTFWSQAVIAEVYALHLLLLSTSLLLLLRWDEEPTTGRLTAFLAVYALSFGNHLTSILLLPAYGLFLLTAPRERWQQGVARRAALLALGLAAAASLQYLWNLRTLWIAPVPAAGLSDAAGLFWFDVTKSDWRDVMIMGIHPAVVADRLRMYSFDLRQQFGWPAILIALVGGVHMLRRDPRRASLLLLIYAASVLFALGYNVGDAYVFLLPSHLTVALLVPPGIVAIGRAIRAQRLVAAVLLAAVGARIYIDYPALDRGHDRRPVEVIDALARHFNATTGVLVTSLNWQIQNGLSYYTKVHHPEFVHARLADVSLYLPALVRDNHAIDRSVAVTSNAKTDIEAAYGPLFDLDADPRASTPRLADIVRALPEGTRYVLTVLRPLDEFPIDLEELQTAVGAVSGGTRVSLDPGDYSVLAGRMGATPAFTTANNRPFRRSVDLEGVSVQIRMDSWLAFDTIRRMGFGHVIVDRHHALIVERGISFVAFDDRGEVIRSAYRANIFAPEPRYLVRR